MEGNNKNKSRCLKKLKKTRKTRKKTEKVKFVANIWVNVSAHFNRYTYVIFTSAYIFTCIKLSISYGL